MTGKTTVQMTVEVSNIKDKDKDIYLFLFNKYKDKIQGASFSKKIKAINECMQEEQYNLLEVDTQQILYYELQSLK